MMHRSPTRSRTGGFSLIEMVVVMTIMAVLVGAAVPVTSKILTARARKETRAELVVLAAASLEYFRDAMQHPSAVADLIQHPDGIAGWSGPYVTGAMEDLVSGLSTFEVDAWSRAYRVSSAGDTLAITSAGPDADYDSEDDLEIVVNTTMIRREKTLERVAIVNQSIATYNALYQAIDPLPANYSVLFGKLVTKGLLPPDPQLQVDAWGAPFVENPVGMAPVMRIQSPSMGQPPDTSNPPSIGVN